MNTVYLISCTKSKQNYECYAEEMYKTSSLYNYSLNYALNHVEDKNNQIFILSAKHHLLRLNKVIKPYECTLKNMNSQQKQDWGYIVYKQLDVLFDIENTEFIFLAGNDYIDPLVKYLVNWSNPVPKENRELGKRLSWLKYQNKNSIPMNIPNKCEHSKSISSISFISAKELRTKNGLNQINKHKPGWYKWWAPNDVLEIILNSQFLNKRYLEEIRPSLTKTVINNETYYCIYVGIAVNESIQDRIDWHVNQKHNLGTVKSGFLSTLRQSIASLSSLNQMEEDTTNSIIDMLKVEIHYIEEPIKSNATKNKLITIEENLISEHVLPLNIKSNKQLILSSYLKELKKIRKISKPQ